MRAGMLTGLMMCAAAVGAAEPASDAARDATLARMEAGLSDPRFDAAVQAGMRSYNAALQAVNLRAERGRWPLDLADLVSLTSREFDVDEYCSWLPMVETNGDLHTTTEARDRATGACSAPVTARIRAVYGVHEAWRYEYLAGAGADLPAESPAGVILRALLYGTSGRILKPGKQAPEEQRLEVQFAPPP